MCSKVCLVAHVPQNAFLLMLHTMIHTLSHTASYQQSCAFLYEAYLFCMRSDSNNICETINLLGIDCYSYDILYFKCGFRLNIWLVYEFQKFPSKRLAENVCK